VAATVTELRHVLWTVLLAPLSATATQPLADPTLPPAALRAPQSAAAPAETAEPARLQMILTSHDGSARALIGGAWLRVGDRTGDGGRLLRIDAGAVQLLHDGRERTLALAPLPAGSLRRSGTDPSLAAASLARAPSK
jgi:hypothetical protein